MCFGGNIAPLSSHYINTQLGALWDNAKLCAAHSQPDFKSEEYERSKYTRALFHFHYLGRRVPKNGAVNELPFFAEFGKPEIKFICNHDAMLTLTITRGHISLGPEHAHSGTFVSNTTLENVKLVYRMPFERSNVKGNDSKIGNESAVHLIQMIALQLDSATLIKHERLSNLDPQLHNGFFERMRDYLKFLRSAGHHVLFDLSDFDDNKYRPLIDYSVAQESVLANEDFSVFGVSIKSINDYLERQWMAAASLLTTLQDDVESRLPDVCLAELSSNWTQSEVIERSFYIRFGAPTIRAICAREIILTFYVEDIAFFGSTDFESYEPEQVCHKWRVSFVLNVVPHPDEVGALILDFGHPRFSIHDSFFDKEHKHFFDTLVVFLRQEYISIVARYPLQFIYRPQAVVVDVTTRGRGHSTWSDTDELESDWESNSTQAITIQTTFWTRRVQELHLANYDQVATISEDSINTFFQLRRKAAAVTDILASWTEDIFQADFGALRVRLLSNGRAIVYITIESGQIPVRTAESASQVPFWKRLGAPTVHGSKTEPWSFETVVLAFEVDLAFETAAFFDFEAHVLTDIHTGLSVNDTVLLKHLALDLRSAKFNRSLSSVRTLGTDRDALGKLDTLMHYVISYLGRLTEHGHGVLYSTTIATDRHRESLSFTEVDFKVLTKHEVSVHHIAHMQRSHLESSFILIYGVCSHKPLVPYVGGWSPFWLPSGRGRTGLGTICFSRELFLERYLLKYLQEFNAETTIVPKFAGVVNGALKFDLTTWAEHDYRGRAGEVCAWRVGAKSDKILEYVWHHRDDWRHQYEGSSYTNEKGEYSLSCDTNNTLRIPTEHRPGRPLEIVMTGKTTIKVSGKVGGKVWSKTTDALWSTTVAISSRHNGLHVSVQSTKPVVEIAGGHLDSGDFGVDVADIHRKNLSVQKFTGLETSLRGIKSVLESAWGYSASGVQTFAFVNPVFTQHGDLVVELSLYDKLRTDLGTPRGTPRVTPRNSSFGALGKPPLGNGHASGNGVASRVVSSQEGFVTTPSTLLQRSFSAASAPETPLETPASALTASGNPFYPAEGKPAEGQEPVAFSLQQSEAV